MKCSQILKLLLATIAKLSFRCTGPDHGIVQIIQSRYIRREFYFILVLGSADPIFSKIEIKMKVPFSKIEIKIKVPLINFILSAGGNCYQSK